MAKFDYNVNRVKFLTNGKRATFSFLAIIVTETGFAF